MKKTMKRGLTVLLCAALITMVACNKEEKSTIPVIPNRNTDTVASSSAQQTEETVKDEALSELYSKIEEAEAFCAVAYLGYTEGPLGDGYKGWFEENAMMEIYPLLANIPVERIIEQDGGEVYCIIPKQNAANISVYAQGLDSNGVLSAGEELFHSSDAQPLIVRGNISEIVPNMLVQITGEDGSVNEFSPALSGMDGRLAMEEENILDISLYLYQDIGMMHDVYYWEESNIEGTWICNALTNDKSENLIVNLEFYPDENSKVVFWYGTDYNNVIARYEGIFYESDIPADPPQIMMELNLMDGSEANQNMEQTLQMVMNLKNWYTDDGLDVIHLEGDPLLPGLENTTVYFERTYG